MARRSRSTREAAWTLEALHLSRHRRKKSPGHLAILTNKVSSAVASVHERIPVILPLGPESALVNGYVLRKELHAIVVGLRYTWR